MGISIGTPVGVPDGVVPAGVRRRQGGFDDLGLGGELGEVPVEGLRGPGRRAARAWRGPPRGRRRPAPPIRLRGSDRACVELLVHAGLGEVDGAAVRGGGAGQILEHAPDLVVEPLLHGPAGRVARDGPRRAARAGPGARWAAAGAERRSAGAGGCSRSGRRGGRGRLRRTCGGSGRAVPGPVRAWGSGLRAPEAGPVRGRRLRGAVAGAGTGPRAPWARGAALAPGRCRRGRLPGAVAVRRARPGRCTERASALGHRLVDAVRELAGLGQALVGEELGEAARVALADGAHLPGALAAVELQRDDAPTRRPGR